MYSLDRSQRATAHTLQNVSEVNRERSCLAGASSVCDSTKHNGIITQAYGVKYLLSISGLESVLIKFGRVGASGRLGASKKLNNVGHPLLYHLVQLLLDRSYKLNIWKHVLEQILK